MKLAKRSAALAAPPPLSALAGEPPDLATVRVLVSEAWKCLRSEEPQEQRSAIWRLVDAAGLLSEVAKCAGPSVSAAGVDSPTDRGFQILASREKR